MRVEDMKSVADFIATLRSRAANYRMNAENVDPHYKQEWLADAEAIERDADILEPLWKREREELIASLKGSRGC